IGQHDSRTVASHGDHVFQRQWIADSHARGNAHRSITGAREAQAALPVAPRGARIVLTAVRVEGDSSPASVTGGARRGSRGPCSRPAIGWGTGTPVPDRLDGQL